MRINQFVERNIAVITLNNFGFRLDGTNNTLQFTLLLIGHIFCFIEKYRVTEFYLLDNETFQIIFTDISFLECATIIKLLYHAKTIDYSYDTVKTRYTLLNHLWS